MASGVKNKKQRIKTKVGMATVELDMDRIHPWIGLDSVTKSRNRYF